MSDTTPPTSPVTEPTAIRAISADTFAFKLKTARTAAGLSQKQVGGLAKVSSVTIGNWENARSEPSPQKQAAVLRRLREAAAPRNTIVVTAEPSGEIAKDATASVALDHDPYDPMTLPDPSTLPVGTEMKVGSEIHRVAESAPSEKILRPDDFASPNPLENVDDNPKAVLPTLPEIPIGNVHTSEDGVVRRRLADDDEREGVELIDGRKWFTVGFAPPHPRAKAAVKPIAVTPTEVPPAPIPATPERPEPRVHTETTPKAPEPAEASQEPAVAGKRDWAWWNS